MILILEYYLVVVNDLLNYIMLLEPILEDFHPFKIELKKKSKKKSINLLTSTATACNSKFSIVIMIGDDVNDVQGI